MATYTKLVESNGNAAPAFDDTSPADGVTATCDLDVSSYGPIGVDLDIIAAIPAGASGSCVAQVFISRDGGTNYTHAMDYDRRFGVVANSTNRFGMRVPRALYFRVEFTNNCGGEITSLTMVWSGQRFETITT